MPFALAGMFFCRGRLDLKNVDVILTLSAIFRQQVIFMKPVLKILYRRDAASHLS